MKGQNQAVALILLIGITVAGVAALSEQVFGLLNSQSPEEAVPDANPGELRMMSCWNNSTHTKFSMRNGQEQKLNTSSISLLVNGSLQDFAASREIIQPQNSFRLEVNQVFTDEGLIKIVSGDGKQATFRCRNL